MNHSFEAQTILVAEDNEDDIFIFERAYKQTGTTNPVQIVRDGEEAHDYLSGTGRFADRARYPLPHLLLLDLKLPLRPGLELLAWLRMRPELADLRVVILTSSAEQRDLAAARELGARYYLVKPPRAKTLADLIARFRAEWVGERGATGLEGDLFAETEAKR